MAVKNRTDAVSQVNAVLQPTITASAHRGLLNNDILNSVEFRKDVIAAVEAAAGLATADFTSADTVAIDADGDNVTISFAGLENGDVRYIDVLTAAAKTISFTGATDMSIRQAYVTGFAGNVQYRVTNKNGSVSVETINVNNNIEVLDTIIEIGVWDMDADDEVSVVHGLPTGATVYGAHATIIGDSDFGLYDLGFMDSFGNIAGAVSLYVTEADEQTVVRLKRKDSGFFDSTSFDDGVMNRGHILIHYTL